MRKLVSVVVTFIFMSLMSCSDAARAKMGGLGNQFKIELFNCDGTVAKTYISSGKVSSERNSDGYYFMEKKTGKLIQVTGTLVITKL